MSARDLRALRPGGRGWTVEKPTASVEPAAEAVSELTRRRAQLHGAFGNEALGRLADLAKQIHALLTKRAER
jgi:hypothetical protein